MRSNSITYVLVPMLLAGIAQAAEPAAKPTDKPAAPKAEASAVELPGEILLRTPSLEASWRNVGGRHVLASLVDRRDEEPLLIGQDAFILTFADGTTLASSQMKAKAAVSTMLKPANKPDSSAGERAGGRQTVVALSDEDTGVLAKWTVTHRNGADYIRQTVAISGEKPAEITGVRYFTLQLPGVKETKSGSAVAAATDAFAFAAEDGQTSVSIDGAKVRVLSNVKAKIGSTNTHTLVTIIAPGAEALAAAQKNEMKVVPVVAMKKSPAKAAAKPEPAKVEMKKPDAKPAPAAVAAKPSGESKSMMNVDPNAVIPAGRIAEDAPEKPAMKKEAAPAKKMEAPAKKTEAPAKKAEAPAKKVEQPKPAPAKPVYKFPENLNPNAPLPAN